tara:strand:+ start:9 stop:140 length:132 start_codon:yes stop_codon:yes gene_type:complete
MKIILIVLFLYFLSKVLSKIKINNKNNNSNIIDVDYEEVDESN